MIRRSMKRSIDQTVEQVVRTPIKKKAVVSQVVNKSKLHACTGTVTEDVIDIKPKLHKLMGKRGTDDNAQIKPVTKSNRKTKLDSKNQIKTDDKNGSGEANFTGGESKQKLVGAHVSVAGGLENAPINAALIGARAFGMFLKSQRQWNCKSLDDSIAENFKLECQKHGFPPHSVLPHGSYLLNCGAPNLSILEKSRAGLTDELQRCEKLGLTLFNFHPGSTCGEISVDECLDRIAESINLAHAQTKYVITVVENMSCQGNTVGGKFEELRGIIDRVKDKSRIGICIDTCHAFAAGYDISTKGGFDSMMEEFESVVGIKYLKALHLNDSKGKIGCHLDRHENIGKGYIGKEAFKRIMLDPRFNNMPMILETPYSGDEIYEREIKMLCSFEKDQVAK